MPAKPSDSSTAFVGYLLKLAERDNGRKRAAIAALKSGLANPPASLKMAPYLVPWTKKGGDWWRDCFYMIASLFTLSPFTTGNGNFGDHLYILSQKKGHSLELRVQRLLAANTNTLYSELRACIGLLAQAGIPINWAMLLTDLTGWKHPSRYIQKRWAAAYYGVPNQSSETASQETENPLL